VPIPAVPWTVAAWKNRSSRGGAKSPPMKSLPKSLLFSCDIVRRIYNLTILPGGAGDWATPAPKGRTFFGFESHENG
jgi:hypothetical protein